MTVTIFFVLLLHWIADFVLQSDEQAVNKSKSFRFLIEHTTEYSLYWLFGIFFLFSINGEYVSMRQYIINSGLFVAITFITHTGIDFVTSKINSKLWEKEKRHNYFVSIGFDQMLHYCQLFLTYQLLTN